jgi:hypothetical protein
VSTTIARSMYSVLPVKNSSPVEFATMLRKTKRKKTRKNDTFLIDMQFSWCVVGNAAWNKRLKNTAADVGFVLGPIIARFAGSMKTEVEKSTTVKAVAFAGLDQAKIIFIVIGVGPV